MSEDPEKVAVALRYTAPDAPTVVATGRGHTAEAILAKAREAGVPIDENPLLAAALATLAVDERVPEDLYRAVAAVVAMVMRAAEATDRAGRE
ncbi:MAG TPA: EscU/YscU/HrcU family type III secretion system export apparatus switch protein [Methylomirabilota bacterium]|nr:EscU/YscU/HrcU family type III secretion system export apparatus switch protein [Methylomirabilota bacterium]